ncbi:MAG TPA: c-type cytochrome [Haliscomenobacter sp.]|uniref:c-type cytochrome n=1 Tax=Haliscomenobacter sp. TaxID=2717303 RepID=UPI002CB2A166|nr:c-type cytochrome [Haliscomenobacter sp.]HOY20620.1 c-type cytochrome [Haliscomenobacter sp.]
MSTEKFHHFGASFGVILAIFISSLAFLSTDPQRPEEVWVIRSVLDKQPRMLTLALDSACYLAYSLTRCQLYKAWKGGVSLDGAPYTDKKEIQPSSWGASYWIDSTITNRWRAEKNGISVFKKIIHKGYRLKNNQIFLRFALVLSTQDTVWVEECPEFVRDKSGKIGLERTFKTLNVPAGVAVNLSATGTQIALKSNGTTSYTAYFSPLPDQVPPIPKPDPIHAGRTLMNKADCFTCHNIDEDEVGPSFKKIAQKYRYDKKNVAQLALKIKNGSRGTWGNSLMNPHPNLSSAELTAIVEYIFTLKPKEPALVAKRSAKKNHDLPLKSKEQGFGAPLEGVHPSYDLVNLHTAAFKPRVGGLAFLSDGRLLVTTWDKVGGVYLLDGVTTGDASKISVKRIAFGLAEPLGIEVVNDEIYVLQKQELTKLVDLDGDEIIDEYQAICNSWDVSADFHEFAFGLVYKEGYFYATLSMAMRLKPDEKQLPDRGKTIKIAKNGSFEVVNFGLRTPNGIGLGVDNELFITDNQGQWLPANKLIHVKKGEYHGMQWGWLSDDPAPEMAMPAIWLPENDIGNSPSEPVLIREGIFKGQMLHGDVTFGGINRDFLEKIEGQYQGAVFMFSQGFEAGVNRLRWGPDGALYVGEVGMMGGGWSWKERLSGLQRLKYNGKPTFEMLAVRAQPKGFEIEFTEPLKQNTIIRPADLWMQQWWYLPTKNYGGPKMDLEKLKPTRITISADRKRVAIEVPELKPKHVVYFQLPKQLKSQSGQSLWSGETWYTLNVIPRNL